ncbi:MAG: MG2 domain-containing protein, partial [Myxococcaceae bacterium]
MLSRKVRGIAAGVIVAGVAVLVSTQVFAGRATPLSLGGKDRYLTSVSTDKPIYHPGEKVYARGVVLHAFTHAPLPAGQQTQTTIEVKGPKGDTVASGFTTSADSVWSFAWDIPGELPGGEYTLQATYPWTGHAPAERKFDVRVFRAPRLKSQIVFMRDGYGPGDKVSATLDVKRAEGGAPAGAKVTAIARVDGVEVARVPATVDGSGLCTVSFELPKSIARGDGSLAFAIEDGGVVETAAKTIPILLQTVDLKLYPEGGELVAGLASRVYFEARTPSQKPGDIAGVVMSDKGEEVARFRSEHEGRGRFAFTPAKGGRYTLKITEPAGIKTTFPLPAVKASGTVVKATQDLFGRGGPVKLVVASTADTKLKVTLSQRELELSSAAVNPSRGTEVSLDPRGADGVLVVTVWDGNGIPLAERLVFRQPAEPLSIEVRADKKSYVPGDTVKLTARTTRGGKPVAAVVSLTVSDDAVLEMVEKREQVPGLPAMVLLEPEVQELADAHVYLDEKNPKAPLAVDLLLGTQGWRRFSFMDATSFVAQHGDGARRVLALRIQSQVEVTTALAGAGGMGMKGEGRGGMNRPGRAMVPMAPPPPMPMAMKPAEMAPPPPVAAAQPVERPAPGPRANQGAPRQMAEMLDVRRVAKDDVAMQDALVQADEQKAKKQIMGKREMNRPVVQQNLVMVREFAHPLRPNRQPTDRVDFTETLYWNAGVKTDAKTGEAQVSFALNDSVTSFKAIAGGFSEAGNLGAGVATVESVQPFYLEPKMPLEVTAGDVVRLPVAVVNGTSGKLSGVTLTAASKGDLRIGTVNAMDLRPGDRVRHLMELKVGNGSGKVDFTLAARAGAYADNVTRQLSLKPNGFPFEVAFGGLVGPDKPASHALTIPENVVVNSVRTSIAIYPTPLANMTEALSRLIVDPSGCFEQTSSTSYPLTMAQQYFTSHAGVDPKLVESAKQKLEAGYQRLKGFECPEKGYEWFGENPGHEALTAYGLLHFTDMAKVREVDQKMLANTRAWLMKQRDGKGGFERKRRALHTWIEDKDCSNAYITWALLESGEKEVGKEVASLKAAAAKSENSYVVALAGNVMA